MMFDSLLEDIQEWMLQLTSDTIADNLISIARYCTLNVGHHQLRALSDRAQKQIEFGKEAYFAGLWMLQWRQDQEQINQSSGSKRDSGKWICHTINKIQNTPPPGYVDSL
jgi:hypothetical protein